MPDPAPVTTATFSLNLTRSPYRKEFSTRTGPKGNDQNSHNNQGQTSPEESLGVRGSVAPLSLPEAAQDADSYRQRDENRPADGASARAQLGRANAVEIEAADPHLGH